MIAGFAVIIFNIFAVNFWISGLHSYAGAAVAHQIVRQRLSVGRKGTT